MNRSRHPRGFTLVELLVVIVVMSILIALVVPAVTGPLSASSLSTGAGTLADDLKAARQDAVTRNRSVEVRFFAFDDAIRAYEINRLEESGLRRSLTGLRRFPEGILASTETTLTQLGTLQATAPGDFPEPLPAGTRLTAFRFRPDGGTDLDLSQKWFLTLVHETRPGSPPPNFATIQIEPLTGAVRVHRP